METADRDLGTPVTPDSAETPILLREPAEGTPAVITESTALDLACQKIAAGTGPIAVDTERASGYKYWPKAYLVQLRREGAGSFLIDPIPLAGKLAPLAAVLNEAEWVLHAASQDLPCLAELDLRPTSLFDTELAGRLAGHERVALGTMVEKLLGYHLEKGHSAADWSKRPLPLDWLNYAALDVELLLPLRKHLEAELAGQGKLAWAQQEFEAVRTAKPALPKVEPWRKTSGIHKIRTARGLAVVRGLWEARNELSQKRDRAPGRVLPDSAIISAVLEAPRTIAELEALPVFGGRFQRKYSSKWFYQIQKALRLPESELPSLANPTDGPPPVSRWAEKDPAAAARLSAARTALTAISVRQGIPAENLLLPDLLRRTCWKPPVSLDLDSVIEVLTLGGARPWQIELTAEALATALLAIPAANSSD